MTNLRRSGLLAVLAAFAFAACGGGAATTAAPGGATQGAVATQGTAATQSTGGQATQQPGGGGATVDACALLTDDDIKAVTGLAVSKKTAGPQGGVFPSGCLWELAGKGVVPPNIALGILTVGGKSFYDTNFKPFQNEQNATPVTGVGDEAVDVGFGVIQAVSGDAFFNLQYIGEGDHEIELSKRVVANLP